MPRSSIRSPHRTFLDRQSGPHIEHSISDSKKHGKTYSTDMKMIVYASIVSQVPTQNIPRSSVRSPHRTFLDRQSGPHTEHSSIISQVLKQNIPRSSVRSPHRTFLDRQSLTIMSPHRTFLDRQSGPHTEHSSIISQVLTQNIP